MRILLGVLLIGMSACGAADEKSNGAGSTSPTESSASGDAANATRTPQNETASAALPSAPGAAPMPPPQAPTPVSVDQAAAGVHTPCVAPTGVTNDPGSFDDVVALVNSLPKPTTLVCYLESLRRPLHVNATSSTLSVQAAAGATSPRLFLFSGGLISSVVPDGDGNTLLELSALMTNQTSVKGEIKFPVAASLEPTAPTARVARSDKPGTHCAACHSGETAVGIGFVSRAIKPFNVDDVSLATLTSAVKDCAIDPAPRCAILRAVLGLGDVVPQAFPASMPTMF